MSDQPKNPSVATAPRAGILALSLSAATVFGGGFFYTQNELHEQKTANAELVTDKTRLEGENKALKSQQATHVLAGNYERLVVQADRMGRAAQALCDAEGVSMHISEDEIYRNTLSYIELQAAPYRRYKVDVTDVLARATQLEDNNVRVVEQHLPEGVMAQYMQSPRYGRVLVIDDHPYDADVAIQSFIATLAAENFTLKSMDDDGAVRVLARRNNPDKKGFGDDAHVYRQFNAKAGAKTIYWDIGEARYPVAITPKPCP